MIRAILFDMDGTLLPMDVKNFEKLYFKSLAARVAPLGYQPQALVDGIWRGTVAMVKNDGSCLNSEAFWRTFADIFGEQAFEHVGNFDDYYRTDFVAAKAACGLNPKAAEIVKNLKKRGLTVVVATNPLFPEVAQEQRLIWAGIDRSDVDLITHYDNSHYCKPNLKYYEELLVKLNLKSEECVMVGNDVNEDMIARELGMKVFLITDCLLNPDGKDISVYPNGTFEDLAEYLLREYIL
ncbi:MAG: HAD family hydrolase [Clostridiales bacterium]|nr:HAD family hydrolase [Clostridiales bacterium]